MRVYVPLTPPGLARVVDAREIGGPPLEARAVTPELREAVGSDDLEELEYAAMAAAADGCLRLLAEDTGAPRRRVVLAAEAPDDAVRPGPEPNVGDVLVDRPLPLTNVMSGHVDEPEAATDVARAVDTLAAADDGDGDALAVLDELAERELLWYARQELPEVVEELWPERAG